MPHATCTPRTPRTPRTVQVGRLQMTVMMLDRKVLSELRQMFDNVQGLVSGLVPGAQLGGRPVAEGGEGGDGVEGRGLDALSLSALAALPSLRATFGVA